ncbi:MAG: antibiotic biosynthesis monooxygenase [Promethearchaeota archaeon]
MIARMWHGRTSYEKSDEYAEFLKSRAVPDYQSVKGLLNLSFMRRDEGDITHFLLITHWDSVDPLKEFARENYYKAKYYEEDDFFLLEKEENVIHYEIFYNKN